MEEDELDLKKELKELKQQELEKRKRTREDEVLREKKFKPNAIYLSNLNKDTSTEDQLIVEFSKFGAIKRDEFGKPKCKLYKDEDDKLNGDALIVYTRPESVPIAIEMMDGYEINGLKIKVEIAQFQNKKRKLDYSKDEETKLELIETPNTKNDESKSYTVIIGNILDLYEDYHEQELDDIEKDILDGCLEIGPVNKINLRSVTGEAEVNFENEDNARQCREKMNSRYFDGRRLSVYIKGEEEEPLSDEDSERYSSEEDDLLEM